jgi:hypothetical protein
MNLPPELEVGVNMNQWLSELTQNKVNVTRPSFQTVKVQFYALGLIRIEMLMRRVFFASNPAPQPALCWVLTEAGRATLADLLGEKRPEAAALNLV